MVNLTDGGNGRWKWFFAPAPQGTGKAKTTSHDSPTNRTQPNPYERKQKGWRQKKRPRRAPDCLGVWGKPLPAAHTPHPTPPHTTPHTTSITHPEAKQPHPTPPHTTPHTPSIPHPAAKHPTPPQQARQCAQPSKRKQTPFKKGSLKIRSIGKRNPLNPKARYTKTKGGAFKVFR